MKTKTKITPATEEAVGDEYRRLAIRASISPTAATFRFLTKAEMLAELALEKSRNP